MWFLHIPSPPIWGRVAGCVGSVGSVGSALLGLSCESLSLDGLGLRSRDSHLVLKVPVGRALVRPEVSSCPSWRVGGAGQCPWRPPAALNQWGLEGDISGGPLGVCCAGCGGPQGQENGDTHAAVYLGVPGLEVLGAELRECDVGGWVAGSFV